MINVRTLNTFQTLQLCSEFHTHYNYVKLSIDLLKAPVWIINLWAYNTASYKLVNTIPNIIIYYQAKLRLTLVKILVSSITDSDCNVINT